MFNTDPIEQARALLAKLEKQKKDEDELARQAKALAPPSGFRARISRIFRPHDAQLKEITTLMGQLLDKFNALDTSVRSLITMKTPVADPDVTDVLLGMDKLKVTVDAALRPETPAPSTTSTTNPAPGGSL